MYHATHHSVQSSKCIKLDLGYETIVSYKLKMDFYFTWYAEKGYIKRQYTILSTVFKNH